MSLRQSSRHLLTALVIVGCPGLSASAGTIRHDGDDLLYRNLADDYPSVGQIRGTKLYHFGTGDVVSSFAASGTLIAPNWVLTAAHAISDDPAGISKGVPFEVASLEFILGEQTYIPSAWIPYDGFDWQFLSGTDIGLVQFSQDLAEAADVEPAKRYKGRNEFGRVGTSVGYGATGTGLTGADLSVGIDDLKKRAGNNRIDAGVVPERGQPRIFLSDFDNPDNDELNSTGDNVFGSPYPLDLEYLIAPGDSGGGLFIEDKPGEDLLAGVHSFVWGILDQQANSDYGDLSGHTRVSVFNGWINNILKGDLGKGGVMRPGQPFDGQTEDWADLNGAVVPEPSTLCLLCIGGLCLLGRLWRRKRP